MGGGGGDGRGREGRGGGGVGRWEGEGGELCHNPSKYFILKTLVFPTQRDAFLLVSTGYIF